MAGVFFTLRCTRSSIRPRAGEIVSSIRKAAAAVPGVREIDKCLVRKMGLEFYVDLHVGVDEDISVRAGHSIAHMVKDAIRQTDSRIADVLVHVEPAGPSRQRETTSS